MACNLLTSSCSISSSQCFRSRQRGSPKPVARGQAATKAECQQGTPQVSRRSMSVVGLGAAVALLRATPAQAFLGFGGPSGEEVYAQETADILQAVTNVIHLPKDDPSKVDTVAKVRTQTNSWVAKYRRDARFGGRPSYGNTYSALNALAGHYNSFGPEANLPKKRLERIEKELSDATRLLARGR